jgi:stress response protein YsnF
VRLRKWVETQTVAEEVTLHREHVRLEREPVSLGSDDVRIRNAQIGEAEFEVWLRDEHVVASKVIVPREVVRLSKDVVPETLIVEADLRHEEVAVETSGSAENGADDGLVMRS